MKVKVKVHVIGTFRYQTRPKHAILK